MDDEEIEEDRLEFELRDLDNQSRIARDIDLLEQYYIKPVEVDSYSISLCGLYSLVILMMEGYVRYGYERFELLIYMMDLLGPMKGYLPMENLE